MIKTSQKFSGLGLLILILILSGCSPYFHQIKIDVDEEASHHIYEILHQDYPFADFKNIDFHSFADSLNALNSNKSFNKDAYLRLKHLTFSLPDSRISLISGKDKKLIMEETGGYIGFDIAYSDTGEYFVSKIDSLSDAWIKGIRPGYRILGWEQQLISEAVESFPLRWGFHPATKESRRLSACHFITRGKPGRQIEVFYENDRENNKGIKLEFIKSQQSSYPEMIGIIEPPIKKAFEFRKFNDTLAYFRIDQFTPNSSRQFNKTVVGELGNLSGLIIDLRQNTGGYDPIAVRMAGHFVSQARLYEKSFIKEGDDAHIINTLITQPEANRFLGNVIILTGPMTMGVAEGFARILQMEDNIRLLGSWNTAGSFSLPGGRIKLNNGISLIYPIGGSLDENNEILIESGEYQKGIHPDIYIPPTKEVIMVLANGWDVLLEEAKAHVNWGFR